MNYLETLGSAIRAEVAVSALPDSNDLDELFVLYAFLYIVGAVNVLVDHLVQDETLSFFFGVLSVIGAIVALFAIHARVREWRS